MQQPFKQVVFFRNVRYKWLKLVSYFEAFGCKHENSILIRFLITLIRCGNLWIFPKHSLLTLYSLKWSLNASGGYYKSFGLLWLQSQSWSISMSLPNMVLHPKKD